MGFLDNLFNMADKREIKAFSKVADKIDAMEPKFEAMTNKELKNMTNIFKEKLKIIAIHKPSISFRVNPIAPEFLNGEKEINEIVSKLPVPAAAYIPYKINAPITVNNIPPKI